MINIIAVFIGIVLASFFWTLYGMKKDGYFDGNDRERRLKNNRPKRGSIVFFKDSVKHVK